MARILLLDTATEVCSAALAENGEVAAFIEEASGYRHAELLTVFISELLNREAWDPGLLDAVCVSRGPGSYTGLRIGVSIAKGICYGLAIPLIAVSSLHSMAHRAGNLLAEQTGGENPGLLLCPMLDARRMEVYTAFFTSSGKPLTEIKAEIIRENSFREEMDSGIVYFFGNGVRKCKSVITHPNARFLDDIYASARFMSGLAEESYFEKRFENVAYFEPFYLKDFVATVPRNKIL